MEKFKEKLGSLTKTQLIISACAALLALSLIVTVISSCGGASEEYRQAISDMKAGNYGMAANDFAKLGDYKKSEEYLAMCNFYIAKEDFDFNDVPGLRSLYNELKTAGGQCTELLNDPLFTIMRLLETEYVCTDPSYEGYYFKFYYEDGDGVYFIHHIWEPENYGVWGQYKNVEVPFGGFYYRPSDSEEMIDWFTVTAMDDTYPDAPVNVALRNELDGNEYHFRANA